MNDLTVLNRRIAPIRRNLTLALRDNAITRDLYHKGLVQLAYEYAVAGYADDALGMLLGVEPTYFRSKATEHQKTDPQFAEQARVVAETLMMVGILPTQKVARA